MICYINNFFLMFFEKKQGISKKFDNNNIGGKYCYDKFK